MLNINLTLTVLCIIIHTFMYLVSFMTLYSLNCRFQTNFHFQRVGCDLIIDSVARLDACGVCGGDGAFCSQDGHNRYEEEDEDSSLNLGLRILLCLI